MLEAYHMRRPKPKTIKEMLQTVYDNLSQEPMNKAVKEFRKQLKACVVAGVRH